MRTAKHGYHADVEMQKSMETFVLNVACHYCRVSYADKAVIMTMCKTKKRTML